MKNDCVNNESGTTEMMNRPLALISGTVNAGVVTLSVSSGRLRWPLRTAVVYSGLGQSFSFTAQSATYYTVFARPGTPPTFMVSGTTTTTLPDPPRWDAQYLGQVWTGASLSTANLKGPWNQSADFNPYEQRGEAPTFPYTTALFDSGTPGAIDLDAAPTNAATASGIAFTTFSDRGTNELARGTLLNAFVTYQCSGALQAGALHATPAFVLQRVRTPVNVEIVPQNSGAVFAAQTSTFAIAQNPDSSTPGANGFETVAISALSWNGTGALGYRLGVYVDTARSSSGSHAMGIRIVSANLTAVPGLRVPAAVDTDPD